MTLEKVTSLIEEQINRNGYFINSYNKDFAINTIVPIAPLFGASLGNGLIIAKSTKEEFEKEWGIKPFWNDAPFYFRIMIG